MTTSPSTSLSPSCCSSTLQEGDGVRKSGPIVLLSCSKKKGQPLYAVLSERALELHESEKAQRKKKGTKSIVDLSKCFNVSQQICPKSKASSVCLLMPDECFIFRGENASDTADWYSSLLFAVISARALHLGRPVFPNEFFESVWDVTIIPAQPKLKMAHHNPDNSPNICAKLPHLAGRRRLCFYPHTIIICKTGVEPANSGLPKSGIPPFRTTDFVEFSRHFIASYGSQEKYFIMRIGRGSPMGTCEVWVQCESDECAAEVMNKLTEIIRRETEKKQCALMALGNIVRGSSSSASSSSGTTSYVTPAGCSGASSSGGSPSSKGGDAMIGGAGGAELETISEDEQLPSPGGNNQQPQQQQQPQQERSPSTSISSSSGRPARKKHSSLSASAREKRLELRECKAKVDSLEEEEQRFREQQQQRQQQQEGDWRRGYLEHHRGVGAVQGPGSSSSACSTGSGLIPHSHSRPAYLGCQPDGKLFRRRGSATSMESATLRSKSTSLEQQQQQSQAPLSTRNYNRRSPMELNNNTIDDFDVRWMDRTDSLNLFYNPEEETEDSGGTLRIPCADEEENNSQENSRSASSLNLHNNGNNNGQAQQHGQTQRNLVEALVECHAVGSGGSEDEQRRKSGDEHHQRHKQHHQHQAVHGGEEEEDEDTSTEEECDGKASSATSQSKRIDLVAVRHRRAQQQQNPNDTEQYTAIAARRQRQMTAESSQEAAEEADQSCCSSSIASTSSVTGGREEAHHLHHQPINSEQHQQYPAVEKDDQHHEYTMMDKVSCSSDSFSHLAVPQQWDRQQTMATCCPEEICSCNSDSGDSCYSSMVNGQLNPRALSFSSAVTDGSCGAGNGHGHRVGSGGHGRGARGPEGRHWTMGMVSGMGAHRNGNNGGGGGGTNAAHVLAHPTHFSPPNHPTSAMLPPPNHNMNNNNSSIPDSSSSSRFSMETSLITPLEEELDERRVNFLDNEERDKLDTELVKRGADELRKRAFSLGSKSWITKPFRKLSSTHGPNAVSASTSHQHHHRQVRNSRSGNSSLAGSVHADLSAQPDQNSSQTRLSLSQRLGSSSSFASSSVAGHHNRYRSDSIGSSHSAAFSLPGVSQRVLRKKGPSDEHLPNEDLVELEFMPTTPTSAHSPKPMMVNVATETPVVVRTNTRARTSSYDEPATILYQQQPGTPRGRASAGALDYKMPKVQRGTGTGGSCSWMMTSPREQQQQHAQPHQHQQQQHQRHQQRLRPSESFIRSIQQKQQELQRVRQQQQQQKRPMSRSDFPLQEVQCFIAPAEKEKIDAITARDSHSMHSQRSGSGSTFETIQEGCSIRQQQQSPNHRPSRNRQSSSRASSSMASTGSQHKLCPENEAEEDEYVLGSADSALRVKA